MIEDLKQEISDLRGRVIKMETILENHVPLVLRELEWIHNRLNRGNRPTWQMTAIVTFLSSLCVGLIVAMFRR